MILVDTSVWVDHLRRRNLRLDSLLTDAQVLCHAFVIGEISLGHLSSRTAILTHLAALPSAVVAEHDEALEFQNRHALAGSGIGWVDLHLLASAALSGASLWTLDTRLARIATRLKLQH